MKKKFILFMVSMLALGLSACFDGGDDNRTAPTLHGVPTDTIMIFAGDAFDPIVDAGITATDEVDKTSEIRITSDFVTSWLVNPDTYTYKVTATNTAGKTTTASITITIQERLVIYITAPTVLTYYIGGKPFEPLGEVSAIDSNGENVNVVVENLESVMSSTTMPGEWPYKVKAAKGETVVEKTIRLVVKANANIPTSLTTSPITIEMWHSNGSTIETELNQYAADFRTAMQAQGYNITVNIVKNGATYPELRTNVLNAIKGGTLPHLVQNYPDHVVEYFENKGIASLSPYINDPIHGYPDTGESLADILPSYREENRATSLEGDYLSLPFNKSTEVIVYNKDMFDEILAGKPFPSTWQDLMALTPQVMELKDTYIDRIAARYNVAGSSIDDQVASIKSGFVPIAYDSSSNAFITLSRQWGGVYTSRNTAGNGVLDFNTDANVRQMLTYFGENRDVFTTPQKWEKDYASDQFKLGYCAVTIGSTGGVRYNTPYSGTTKLFNAGVAPMLYDKDTPEARTVIQQGTNISLTTSGTAQEKLAAWYFLKYLTSASVQVRFGIATGYSPIRTTAYSNADYLAYLANANTSIPDNSLTGATYELKIKAMANQAASDQRLFQFFDAPFIGSSAARDEVGKAFERVILYTGAETLASVIESSISAAYDEAMKVVKK